MFGIPFHLLVVHFPIALASIALVYDARGSHQMGYALTLWAAAGAGLAGGIILIALAMLRYSAETRRTEEAESYPSLWLVLQAMGTIAVVMAAITGHRLVLGI